MLKDGDARGAPRASEKGFGEALEQPVSHTRSGRVDLWSALGEQVDLTPKKPRYLDLWSTLRERLDLTKKKPRRVDGIEVVCQASAHGESIYVLKSPLRSSYLKLDARDYFLFEKMDGVHTVRDLALAYFLQFQAFPFDRLLALLAQLKVEGFLAEPALDVFGQATKTLAARRLAYRLQRFADTATQKEVSFKNGDGFFDALYRRGGHLLFTRPAQLLYLTLTPIGLALFVWLLAMNAYPLLSTGGSYGLGLVVLMLAEAVMIAIHECGHALAIKFYGRHIPKAGLLLYFGSLAFFVDATDAWMVSRRGRIVISLAGPFATILVGCVLAIFIMFVPTFPLNAVLFQSAFMAILGALMNLLPLLECDGYFVLMDWLELPMLRQKALAFVKEQLWRKLAARTGWNREEGILASFGLLTTITTGLIMVSALYLWQSQVMIMLRDLLSGRDPVSAVLAGAVTLIVGAPLVLGFVIRGVLLASAVTERVQRMAG